MRTQGTSILRRLFYALVAALWAVGSVAVGVSAVRTGYAPDIRLSERAIEYGLVGLSQAERAMWGIGALASAAFALAVLGIVVRGRSWLGRRVFVLTSASEARRTGGEISVGAQSIQRIASYVATRVDGVMDASSYAMLGRKGWDLDLLVIVPPGAMIPEVAANLRERVGEALQVHTGVPLARLRILAELDGGGPRRTSKRVA